MSVAASVSSLSTTNPFLFVQSINYEKEFIKTVKILSDQFFVVGREKDFSIDVRKTHDMTISESIQLELGIFNCSILVCNHYIFGC